MKMALVSSSDGNYKVRHGPLPYVPIKKTVNERSLARQARYEKLFAARSPSVCDCPRHHAQVNECFCTPACIRGEPEE